MKIKHRTIIVVLALLLIAYGISIIPNFFKRPPTTSTVAALQGLSRGRYVAAVQSFSRDRKASDLGFSNTVALRDLVSGGYLQSPDIRGLEGKDVTISLTLDGASASTVWIAVRESDGSQIGLLNDGRIVASPKQ